MAERILCVLGKLSAGGVESIMYSYYRYLDKTKYQYDFVYEASSEFDIPDEIIKMGARAFKVSDISFPIKYIRDITRLIKREKYRIVHSNKNTLSVFSLFSAFICGVKYRILHNHTTSSPVEKTRTLMKKTLRPFNLIFANKRCACSELAARWMYGDKALEAGKVKVFRNGVDVDKFRFDPQHREEIRKELNIENKRVIGHIGRFMTTKNHLFLIDAFCEYSKINNDAVLILVGIGKLQERVKERVDELGLSDKVIFTGARNDVHKLYSAFDVFVLPSLYEGLPVVGMEACAAGLPLLLSDRITKECAVTDAVSFLPIDAPRVWAERLCLTGDTDRLAIASQMAEGPYNIRTCVKELEEYYSQCK